MMGGRAFEQLADLVYETATDRRGWDEVLRRYGRAVAAARVGLIHHDALGQRGALDDGIGFDAEQVSAYAARFAGGNVWLRDARAMTPGAVVIGSEVVPVWELVRTTFYRDWLRPQGILHAILGAVDRDESHLRVLAAFRPAHGAPFGEAERSVTAALLPHLRHAFAFGTAVRQEAERGEILADLLDRVPEGVFLVDGECRVRYRNQAADTLLRWSDGLKLVGDCLAAEKPEETRQLHALVVSVLGLRAASEPGGGQILVSRPSEATPFLLTVPRRRYAWSAGGGATPVAAVFTRDPNQPRGPSVVHIQELFHMTRAEAHLTSLILGGHGLTQAAAILGVTKNTARTHMKRVYAKTDTHRPMDLLRLLDGGLSDPDAGKTEPAGRRRPHSHLQG